MNNKIISIVIASLIVIGGFIGISLKTSDDVEGPGPTYVSFVISTNTTWTVANSPYIVVGHLLVEKGVTLTIEPGVEVRFEDYYYLQVEGKLIADGTENDMIIFTSNKTTPAPGDWDSIKFMDNADNGSSISYCTIEYGHDAIFIDDSNPFAILNITHNHIINSSYTGIKFHPFSPQITTIDPVNRIMYNTLTNNGGRAIWVHYYVHSEYSNLKIGHNTIQNNLNDGIDCSSYEGKVEIFDNTISGNDYWGIRMSMCDYFEIKNNLISNNLGGGIDISADQWGSIIVENNTFSNNGEVGGSGAGLQFFFIVAPYYTSIHYNNIVDNLPYNAKNNYEPDIIATYNWWGTTDTDLINQSIYDYWDDFNKGEIIYMPFLKGPYSYQNCTILKQGCNLISIPLIQSDESIDKVLSSISGEYNAVQWYNSGDAQDFWKHHRTSKPAQLNDLHKINHTMAFFIYMASPGDTIFYYDGTQPTQNQKILLRLGWNLVGYPSNSDKLRDVALNNLFFDTDVDSIWTYKAETQKWEQLGASDYFEVGMGYWIHAKIECEWEVPL